MNPESSPRAAIVSIGRKVGRLDRRIGPPAEVIPVRLVDPEELRDHGQRKGGRQLGHEIDLLPGLDGVEQCRGAGADRLGKAGQSPRCEPSVDQPAKGGVLGRVHVQDGATLHRSLARAERVIDQRATPRAEVTGVTAQIPDVLVATDGPEAWRTLVHGVLGAQLRQHVEVVVPNEEGGVTGVDLAPLILGHSASVVCRRRLFSERETAFMTDRH